MSGYQAVFEILIQDPKDNCLSWQPRARIIRSLDFSQVLFKANQERARLKAAKELHRGRVVVLNYPSPRFRL